VSIKSDIVLIHVGEEFISAEDLSDLNQLIIVILALEEGLLLEDHTCEHAPERPDVKRVIVSLQVNKELWPFEIPASYSNIVLLTRVIELSESPINKTQLAVLVVDHDVVGLNITMSNALLVAVVESSEDLKDIVSDVEVSEALIESTEVNITCVHVFHDQGWGLGHGISHYINQIDDVHSCFQSLQNLYLSSYLRFLHYNLPSVYKTSPYLA
jgi:hypothetical protein